MDVLRLRWLGDDALEFGGADQFGLAAVPFGQDFGARGAAEDSWMDEAGEANTGYVPAGTEDTLEVPDSFGAKRGRVRSVNVGWSLERGKAYAWG